MLDVLLVETPLNITVIRFIPVGKDVKSMLVPDADTAVPDRIPPDTPPDAVIVPVTTTFPEPSTVTAVAPEPDPVTIFNVPLVSVDIAVPPLVELPAVMIFAMFYP
jgi:hypothetical protein